MHNPEQPILLVSLTARMLAELAVNASYRVLAVDYFGDTDLQARCPSVSLRHDYGRDYSAAALVDVANSLPAAGVVYGASLENHPAEVARLADNRKLLGNSPETLDQVRNPILLAKALRAGGFAGPQTVPARADVIIDPTQRWLWKPFRGGGGHEVRYWNGKTPGKEGVLQTYLPGMVGSATFLANGRQAVVLGLTEQLVGQPAFGAAGFGYCGNLLPPRLPPGELASLLQEIRPLVAYLTQTFGLKGLNGLDFVWHQARVWTIEVNPRPSASLELIDLAYGIRVFDRHVRSFNDELPDFDLPEQLVGGPAAGKAILFAPYDVVLGDTGHWVAQGFRDVPHPGEQIRQNHPVCTILTTGATPADCLQALYAKAARLKRSFNSNAVM
jgi:predicted ATP-grasp superfamily ATP-dependent carboligase